MSHRRDAQSRGGTEPRDYENEYDDLAHDVLWDEAEGNDKNGGRRGVMNFDFSDSDNSSRDSAESPDYFGGRKTRYQAKNDEEGEPETLSVSFDFRRGENRWPEGVELMNEKQAEELVKKTEQSANETTGTGKTGTSWDEDPWNFTNRSTYGPTSNYASISGNMVGFGSNEIGEWGSSSPSNVFQGESPMEVDERSLDDPLFNAAPKEAQFETLHDHSTALLLAPGTRLKLDLEGLTSFGAANQRRKRQQKEKLRRQRFHQRVMERASESKSPVPTLEEMGDSDDELCKSSPLGKFNDDSGSVKGVSWNDEGTGKEFSRWGEFGFGSVFKTYVNKYTITMDVRFEHDMPRSGISLFQTKLVHVEENPRTGKKRLKQSDGECIINSEGGVGLFGSYGDVTISKVTKGKWVRIVVSVACGEDESTGYMRTWINSVPCALLSHQEIVKDGRFSIDPAAFYLFSSKNHAMMPGHIAVRHIRVDAVFSDNRMVKERRARDKIISMFEEKLKEDINEQRKGLSLAVLFPKPRPIWSAPVLTGMFGDAFIEGTTLEASSLLSWSYMVLNHTLARSLYEMGPFLSPLTDQERARVSDCTYVFSKSGIMMTQMMKLLKHPNTSQLLSFLRKLRSTLSELGVGDTLILPALVENRELTIIVTRQTDQRFRFVIVNSDPLGGLKYHAVSPDEGAPKLKYRTCLVLSNVSKKNALDNVFWMAVYNLSIRSHKDDTERFYDILLPFLSGNPLETSLVEAEVVAGATKSQGKEGIAVGPWRSPQRSQTAYVRCLLEALHYLLMDKGLSSLKAKFITLALRGQFVKMIVNDMEYVHPNENGIRICRMACSQLAYSTVKLTDKIQGNDENKGVILAECKKLTESVLKKIKASEDESVELPAVLKLGSVEHEQPKSRTSLSLTDNTSSSLSSPSATTATPVSLPTLGENTVKIKVKHTLPREDCTPFVVEVNKDGQILEVFQRLSLLSGLPVDKQRLIYMGKILDQSKPLKFYGLDAKPSPVIHLAVTKPTVQSPEKSNNKSKKKGETAEPREKLEEGIRQGSQFCDLPMWNISHNDPNPGQAASLKKYIPIDFLQVHERVTNRSEAVHVLRETDKLCTLLDNQNHCIKNDKLLILNIIQHVVTQIVPIPKPRDVPQDELQRYKSERTFRRRSRQRQAKLLAKKRRASTKEADDDHNDSYDDDDSNWNHSSDDDEESLSGTEGLDDVDSEEDQEIPTSDSDEEMDMKVELMKKFGVDDISKIQNDALEQALENLEKDISKISVSPHDDETDSTLEDLNLDYVDTESFTPGLGHTVRVRFHGELGIWYNGTISRLNDDGTYFVVYEDGDTEDQVPRESVRSIFAPRIYPTVAERMKATGRYYSRLKVGIEELLAKRASRDSTPENDSNGDVNGHDSTPGHDGNGDVNDQDSTPKQEHDVRGDEPATPTPDLSAGQTAESQATKQFCIWSSGEINYALQVELLLTLQRLMEHFAAATFSLQQDRALDAVNIIVPGCISAIADVVMRQRAFDTPSEVCSHLLGQTRTGRQLGVPGFGLSVSTFAEQTETIEIHSPELCLARAAVLDYFESPAQRRYLKIFSWEAAPEVRPNHSLIRYLRHICRETAGTEAGAPHYLLLDKHPKSSRLLKNYPELEAFRDIVFWWKYFLNPDITAFPNYGGKQGRDVGRFDRMSAQLSWKWNSENLAYDVRTFGNRFLRCRPFPDVNYAGSPHEKGSGPPKHRFPSTATPSFYLNDPPVATEDDIIYRPTLPGFEETTTTKRGGKSSSASPSTKTTHVLGQHDSELLLSYLTVPYIRLPLTLTFFASDDRLHKLQSEKLRDILDSVLFEPSRYLKCNLRGVEPVMVPTPFQELLATPCGLLMNELTNSPETVLHSTLTLLNDALALDTGSVCDIGAEDFNTSVQIILFAARIGARLDNYLSLLVRNATGSEPSVNPIMDNPAMSKLKDSETVAKLSEGITSLRQILAGSFSELFRDYVAKLDDQVRKNPTDENLIRRNSRLACDLHAHKLILCRNITLNGEVAKTLIGSFIYLTTRHTWNKANRLEGKLLIPEFEIYEVLQMQRRKLVAWCRNLKQGELDQVMQFSLEVSTSTSGSLVGNNNGEDFLSGTNRWSRIAGLRSIGRYAVSSTRMTAGSSTNNSGTNTPVDSEDDEEVAETDSPSRIKLLRERSFNNQVQEISDSEMFGVEMDLQIGQMTLRSRHLSALRSEIANHTDVKLLFGNSTLQVSLLERAVNRERYRLVGLQHDIEYWSTPHDECPPGEDQWEREYDPSELFPSESWIPFVFEPVRKAFFDGPTPQAMQFLLPTVALPEDAEAAVLLGLHQSIGGAFKLVYLFRRLKCVHVYECLSHGRQWFWSLHLATDSRFCLRELQPSSAPRNAPYPQWWKRGAGTPYPSGVQHFLVNRVQGTDFIASPQRSVLIVREPGHPDNLSGGKETFVPKRLLFGVIPDCLLNDYHFWMDETWERSSYVPLNVFSDAPSSEKPEGYCENTAHTGQYPKKKLVLRELRILRGYPIDTEDGEHIIIAEIKQTGSWLDVIRRRPGEPGAKTDNGIEITGGLPGSTIRITRVSLEKYKSRFEDKQSVALAIETLKLMVPLEKHSNVDPFMKKLIVKRTNSRNKAKKTKKGKSKRKKRSDNKIDSDEDALTEKKTDSTNKLIRPEYEVNPSGHRVELSPGEQVKYMVKRSHFIDVVILGINDDGTFDVKGMRGPDAGLILQKVDGRDLHKTRPRGAERGEHIWHWSGMSDSEDEAWKNINSDNEDDNTGDDEPEKDGDNSSVVDEKRSTLTFVQFLLLDLVLEAANNSVDMCMDLLYRIAAVPGVSFYTVESLADAVVASKIDKRAFHDGLTPLFLPPPLPNDTSISTGTKKCKTSTSTVEEEDMVLLNLMYAPRGSRLFSLAKTLTRIENLSNIVAWTKKSNLKVWENEMHWKYGESEAYKRPVRGCVKVDLVELPRLKLSFTVRKDDEGELRLFSLDHADLFVCNDRDPSTTRMLRGIPHSLIVSNARGELQVLVPLVAPRRPKVLSQPFSTDIVLDREDSVWMSFISQRYFLYPVHVSLAFLITRGLESAMYLMLLRFLHRDYDAVFRLSDSIATDTRLGKTAEIIFEFFSNGNDDWHPDAHACRLKISLVTMDCGISQPWDLTTQCARYAVKLSHVRSSCRISLEEELQLLQTDREIVISKKHPKYDAGVHSDYLMTLVKNRLYSLIAIVSDSSDKEDVVAQCWVPPRGPSTSWPYYLDQTVFGETYEEVVRVSTVKEWDEFRVGGIESIIRSRAMARCESVNEGISLGRFPEIEAPKGGWLVLACFHVLWKTGCVKAMQSISELAPTFPGCCFLSLRADLLGLASIGRDFNVKAFPTFVLFRGGTEVEDARIVTEDRITEALARLLKEHVTDEDTLKYEELVKAERRLMRGGTKSSQSDEEDASDEESEFDDEELQWTWDVEQGGPNVTVQGLGMRVVLKSEEIDTIDAIWEWCVDHENTGWTRLPADQNKDLEVRYSAGDLYKQGYVHIQRGTMGGRKIELWDSSNINISSMLLSGIQGRFCDKRREYIKLRRRGVRLPVVGEPEVSQEQRIRDEHLRRQREYELRYKKMMAEQRRGKDVEGIRGTVGFVPNSGIHRWTLLWLHEPATGAGDGVGLCSENCENFGPCAPPCLGNGRDSSSLALYATGELFHHGKCLAKTDPRPRRQVDKSPQDEDETDQSEKEDDNEAVAAEEQGDTTQQQQSKEGNETNNEKQDEEKELLSIVAKSPGAMGSMARVELGQVVNLWGKGSLITCVLDTDSDDGVLTFEIDGEPLQDVSVKGVFHTLGGNVLYPCVSLAPFDKPLDEDSEDSTGKPETVDDSKTESKESDDATSKKRKKKKKKRRDEQEVAEEGGDDDEEDEEEERKALIKLARVSTGIRDVAVLNELDATMLEKVTALADKFIKTQPSDPAIVLHYDETVADLAAETSRKDRSGSSNSNKRKTRSSSERKSSKSHSSSSESDDEDEGETEDEESSTSDEEEDDEDTDHHGDSPAWSSSGSEGDSNPKSKRRKGKDNETDTAKVPIERCVWMHQSEDIWRKFAPEESRKLEVSRRAGAKECEVNVSGERFLVKFKKLDNAAAQDVGEMNSAGSGGERSRVRRQVTSKSIKAGWETLSVKYDPPLSLYGQSALETLESVWSSSETFEGRECGLGFLFLYGLLQGRLRCRIAGGFDSYMWGGFGGFSSWGQSSGKSDSHRFATLLAQLYSDRRLKSVPASIINVLARNRQLCSRMPEFRDTRKSKRSHVFNGWTDERDPRSPLSDLMSQVVPTLQALKRKRGAIHFPPPPPYPELPKPREEYSITVSQMKSQQPRATPMLRDFSCSERLLQPVTSDEVIKLANLVGLKLGETERGGTFRVETPLDIEDETHFDQMMEEMIEQNRLVVIQFHASWCQPCKTLTPTMLGLSRRMPGVKFLRIDVDDCDVVQQTFEIEKLPTIKILRGGATPRHCLTSIEGSVSKNSSEELHALILELCSDEEKKAIERYVSRDINGERTPEGVKEIEENNNSKKGFLGTSADELRVLSASPLQTLQSQYLRLEKHDPVRPTMPFDVYQHEAAGNAVAKSMLKRMEDDIQYWSRTRNSKQHVALAPLPKQVLKDFCSGSEGGDNELRKGLGGISSLLEQLRQLRQRDMDFVETMLPLLTQASNFVDMEKSTAKDGHERMTYLLRRQSGQETFLWLEYLFGALLSSEGVEDILKLNPYLSRDTVNLLFKIVTSVLLRSNRIGHANRCIGACIQLRAKLRKALELSREDRIQREHELVLSLSQSGEKLGELIADGRYYVKQDTLSFDPRFLLFEFTWNLLLRKKQVEIVQMFTENMSNGVSKVKQMIMGAGKTTVVAPLLALMLADGRLVLSVVPKALLEMSRTRMRETFASIMQKRIYTLQFDRSTVIHPSMRRRLENAVRNRGIVVATPTTVKSIMLAYIETLDKIAENCRKDVITKRAFENAQAIASKEPENVNSSSLRSGGGGSGSTSQTTTALTLQEQADELEKILGIFRKGSMLLDEVDLILHPLKSELNFPMGEKLDLDGSQAGERWSLPTHLIDAITFFQRGKVSTFESRGQALDILKRLSMTIQDGYASRGLQQSPHITLLNADYYNQKMKPVLAEWSYLWLQKHHLHGIDRNEAIRYIVDGGEPLSFVKLKLDGIHNAIDNSEGYVSLREQIYDLTKGLYEIEESMVQHMAKSGEELAQLQHHITKVTKAIEVEQYPRDDSLDNNVIVWLSVAFSLNQADSRSIQQASVHSQCMKLEEAGYSIKRCEDEDETVKRSMDLFVAAQLKCIILGGDESRVGCGEDCDESHSTLCLRCGEPWNSHSGHVCNSGAAGTRASFPIDSVDEVFDVVGVVKDVIEGNIPPGRVVVFAAHSALSEEDRMELWEFGVTVVENTEDLYKLVEEIPDYERHKDEDVDTGYSSDDEEDVVFLREVLARDKDGHRLRLVRGRKGSFSDPCLPPPPAPGLERVRSTGTQRLQSLRRRLEALEFAKVELNEAEEEGRNGYREQLAEMRARLQSLLEGAQSDCRVAMQRIPLSLVPEEMRCSLAEELEVTSIHPRVLGVKAADALKTDKLENAEEAKQVYRVLLHELQSLERQALGSKVVACVSRQHKKLLNLTRDWLRTFLPHCLGKVNRVSFGLLNDEDAKRALDEDPLMPRSRLKLAVPFVGKDVPSSSSEFAHPDITIALSVLAYRYFGLRKSDFETIVDDITSQFAQEIGPARERMSSQRYELWVKESGGTVRGVKGENTSVKSLIDIADDAARLELEEKEVVQLKYLQKSNKEQMQKLYKLWKFEPLVIHHYLFHTILPAHMRSQRVKISASGQAVGGDMLFGRRVGFSGTPSDLLPKELGKCAFEDGDDGKMLSTVLDPAITSFEHIEDDWSVENLLREIARATHPRYHALIDTGALITGYSNRQVAIKLLSLGLKWCDGVVFLDNDDKQQVYVRATGRVVSADQCGIPLEKRFAFYDQIHTTGMDIQHVVNARAVITLGKDMTFRDYVQGAFRMRGIGKGQTICAYIIPEVSELMKRELVAANVPGGSYNQALVDIVAWLVINSMRSEQVQWSMLCMQNIANVYRKNALKQLRGLKGEQRKGKTSALEVFHESVDFNLEGNVSDPLPFTKRLENLMSEHSDFILTEEEEKIGTNILEEVIQYSSAQDEISAQKLESEQEREQEQEQEKEAQTKREQQIEVEKFIDREYSRADEFPKSWPFKLLSKEPAEVGVGDVVDDDYPFHQLSKFRLRHQEPLKFPDFLYFSRNYFNPTWNGLRRVKNVVIVMEWTPSRVKIRPLTPTEAKEMHPVRTEQAKRSLEKAYQLLSVRTGELTPDDVLQAVWAATDISLTEFELNDVMAEYGTVRNSMTLTSLQRLLTSGRLRKVEKGRNYVIVSLAEAETLRKILHSRNSSSAPVIENTDTELALRYTPLLTMTGLDEDKKGEKKKEVQTKKKKRKKSNIQHGIILDKSQQWIPGSRYQSAIAYTCSRFLDCTMHFRGSDLNVLLTALQQNSVHDREIFFLHTISCKRRLLRKWSETPLSKVFLVVDEWSSFKQRAQSVFVREAIHLKRLTAWEAFTAFDSDDNGLLSPAEFYGALRWLGVPSLSPNDVIDMFEITDKNRDGSIDYKEYSNFLRGDSDGLDVDQDDYDEEDNSSAPSSSRQVAVKPTIEPFGADLLREVMVQRKSEELQRQEDERVRREAFNKAFDIKIFEEELMASRSRQGGMNPLLCEDEDNIKVCEYFFTSNEKPLRMVLNGHGRFNSLSSLVSTDGALQSASVVRCKRGHEVVQTWRSWLSCTFCGSRNTKYHCNHHCDFNICRKCYGRKLDDMKRDRADLSKMLTYFQCSSGASIGLQVPVAITNNTDDSVSAVVDEELVVDPQSPDGSQCFSITMDCRIEKLPSSGVVHALLKYSQTEQAGNNNRRKRNKANVYVDQDGYVTNGVRSVDSMIGKGIVRDGKFHIISVVSNAKLGTMKTFVDGVLSCCYEGVASEALRLQHQVTIFGGAQQRDLRGGSIRRLIIHNRCLSDEQIGRVCKTYQEKSAMKVLQVEEDITEESKFQSSIKTLKESGFDFKRVGSEEEALEELRKNRYDSAIFPMWKQEQEDEEGKIIVPGLDDNKKPPGINFAVSVRQIDKCVKLLVNASKPKPKAKEYILGEKVEARFRGKKKYFKGQITKIGEIVDFVEKKNKVVQRLRCYDILYDDGDKEENVTSNLIKPALSSANSKRKISYKLKDEHLKQMRRLSMTPFLSHEHLEELVCNASVFQTTRQSKKKKK